MLGISLALAGLTCSESASGPSFEGPSFDYALAPYTLYYHFVDTTAGQSVELNWLPDLPYTGFACLRFYPRDATGQPTAVHDTSGLFAFSRQGFGIGSIARRQGVFTDTVLGQVFTGYEGTQGRYHRAATGRVTLDWSDGQLLRLFDSTSTHDLVDDTLRSRTELRLRGDSIHVIWRVVWVSADCG